MLTIFSSCKPFKGEDDQAQRNAIGSWKALKPQPEILILGDDEGVAEVAQELGVIHISEIERSRFGKPLVSSVFQEAQAHALYDYVCYVNSDIVLMSDFMAAFRSVQSKFCEFLLIGKRYDLDVNEYLDFENDWEGHLQERVSNEGQVYALAGIDYFVFKKGGCQPPAFVLGGIRWDNWMVYQARKEMLPVIDATHSVKAVHQNHEVVRSLGMGQEGFSGDPIAINNLSIYGDGLVPFHTIDATHFIDERGLHRAWTPERLRRRIDTDEILHPSFGWFCKRFHQLLYLSVVFHSRKKGGT